MCTLLIRGDGGEGGDVAPLHKPCLCPISALLTLLWFVCTCVLVCTHGCLFMCVFQAVADPTIAEISSVCISLGLQCTVEVRITTWRASLSVVLLKHIFEYQ